MENIKQSVKNSKYQFNLNLSKPQTLEEYFLIIGIEPKICLKEYLYNTPINEINELYSKEDFIPKILSKFPPIKKKYINIDSTIIDYCFPNGYKLKQFFTPPKPVIQYFLLDNSFYSIDYPVKFVTCLKIYENLEKYFLLKNEIKDKLGNDCLDNTSKINSGRKSKNNMLKDFGNLNQNIHKERFKSEMIINFNYQNYYFTKILCLVSTKPFFKEQKEILKQIYRYFMEDKPKEIPLEKKVLTILFNIPLPPQGFLQINYNLKSDYPKILIKDEKMNKIQNLNNELFLIFSKFSINKVLIILKYIIFETKTIIFSTNSNDITFFIYGLISLLFPFHYSLPISSFIPNGSYFLLESITPYIFGINSKFKKSFFKENKIDIKDINLFIIDLDEKSLKISGKCKIPDIPNGLLKDLHDKLENLLGINKKTTIDKNDLNFEAIRLSFFDFFVNLLTDYNLFLKKDYFSNKKNKNIGINYFFKTKEFIDSHAQNKRAFFKKLTETQMFSDFICKKMIPKNMKDKLEILFVDETLIKKNNKKLFAKKRPTVFLDSKDYEFIKTYEIPQSKNLSENEKNFFKNEIDRNNLIFNAQKINAEIEQNKNLINYTFEYYLFPIFNKSFYEFPNEGEYFLAPNSIIFSDVDRTNLDLFSKSINSTHKTSISKEEEMKNYIYLTYIELWANNYPYFHSSEKENKFNQMLEVLKKISYHEDEFEHLFQTLKNLNEEYKILKLYDCLLECKMNPSSFIYNTVNIILKKKDWNLLPNKSLSKEDGNINGNEDQFIKRTFTSIKGMNIFGEKIILYSKQPCPECGEQIDMVDVSLNYKNKLKELLWAKCPKCKKNILPKIKVRIGSEINNIKKKNNDIINTSKYIDFVLHSPYELKNNIKNIIEEDGLKKFHLENFKDNYPSLFWSCVWYFKLNNIDLDIILPFDKNNSPSFSLNNVEIDKKTNNNINQIFIKDKDDIDKKIRCHKKKFSIGELFDIYRKTTFTNNNKENIINDEKIQKKRSDKIKVGKDDKINTSKKFTMKYDMPNAFQRVRLNTLSQKTILSPPSKSRRLFETNSSKLVNIKECKGFASPFDFENLEEENDEEEVNEEEFYYKKLSSKIFNFEDDEDDLEIHKHRKNRSFCKNKYDNGIKLEEGLRRRNNSLIDKKIEYFLFSF